MTAHDADSKVQYGFNIMHNDLVIQDIRINVCRTSCAAEHTALAELIRTHYIHYNRDEMEIAICKRKYK